ncbi:TRAP transporter substrate-binding protein [Halomonas colorata]|uniref:TRAP transporter substrate-binding protein n=1 Tax=Halomonas colorata TaxID=2742615 RepID=UPI0018661EAE|nr:TRAP transporter substrate-binding protein [Halomonas colorata]
MTKQTTNSYSTHQRLARSFTLGALLVSPLIMMQVQASEITLNYAFFAPAQTFPAVQMEHWAKELERRTDGRVSVNTFPGGTLLTANNMYDGVQSGVADIGLSVTSYEPARFPLLNMASGLTGIDIDSTVGSQVVYDLVNEFPPQQLGLEDFKVVIAFAIQPSYLHSKKPVTSLEDIEGLELRVPGDNTDVIEALGGVPVGLSQAEVGEALQAGVVDGYVSSREGLMDLQYARSVKYVTDYPMTNAFLVAVMNRQRWDSLPKDVQQVIDELGAEVAHFAGDYLDSHIEESLNWAAENHGVETLVLSDEEAERWAERLKPINEARLTEAAEMGLPAYEFYDRMMELIQSYRHP